MSTRNVRCPDCDSPDAISRIAANRRQFLQAAGAVAAAVALPNWAVAKDTPAAKAPPETLVKQLYDSLSETQRGKVAFGWDHTDDARGLLRTHVSNNWHITAPKIASDFYTKDQQEVIRAIFEGLYNPEWIPKIEKQIQDDAGGYGKQQNIAIFGQPGGDKFEFVMTGRHLTIRCDGHSTEHVAFGGPIFYGHAASGFNEKPTHPDNVFWPQALSANKVYEMLDGKQRDKALLANLPKEQSVGFQGEKGTFPGIAVSDMSKDQKEQLQKTLTLLLEPYRTSSRDDALACLKKQGGLDHLSLAFYKEEDLGDDKVWDNWRLEGPSFVWYFRGSPHVHTWVNIADDAAVKLNS